MPRATKPKTVATITATREGSTYSLRIEDDAGKTALHQASALQTLRLADRLDDLLTAEQVELHPPIPASSGASDALEQFGTVKWFNAAKGFGFITPDGGGKELFVHRAVIEQVGIADLPEGARVRVAVSDGKKGPTVSTIGLA